LSDVVQLASKFLLCGTLRAELPYDKVRYVRENYRKIGLGIMGMHEWLLNRGYKYEMNPELETWLGIYKRTTESVGCSFADELSISRPVKFRAIAPAGTISILASTTSGIEPLGRCR
jgi:ribonucleoside-diphosphate reductase alpha chain